MTVTIEELGRRAVACKHWEWLPGMRDTSDRRILAEYETHTTIGLDGSAASFLPTADCYPYTLCTPDLSDRATLALLRDIVARAYGGEQCIVSMLACSDGIAAQIRVTDLWNNTCFSGTYRVQGEHLIVQALVCALEAAPAPNV